MNSAQVTGMRNLWTMANTETRTMTARDMALQPWGKAHASVNVAPDGTRWHWSDRHNAFVCYA